MLIEIDKSVLTEAQNGNQTAFDVLNDLAVAQKKCYHALWADARILEGILKLPKTKLGDRLQIYYGLFKSIRTRKKFYNSVLTKVIVSFNENTRRENNIIYIKPSDKESFSFYKSTLLTENLNDGDIFEYILLWYMRKHQLTVSYNIDKQMGGGNTTADVYIEYAEKKKDRFCLCIADSDIKADIQKLLDAKLISNGEKPPYGETYSKIISYDKKNLPFNCACYCFERVLEIENLIPYFIIANDSNYKHIATELHSKTDLSFFDFKDGLSNKTLKKPKYNYAEKYWKTLIFKNNGTILNTEPILQGFGNELLRHILDKHKDDLSIIDDDMLTDAQKYEYEEIGKRIFSWCCAMKITRSKV